MIEEIYTDNESRNLGLVVDRYLYHRRQESSSTISSSLADDLIRKSEINSRQNNIQIDGNQTVYFGDVINNFHASQLNDESSASDDFISIEDSKTTRRKYCILIIIFGILIAVSIGLGVYLISLNSKEVPTSLNYFKRNDWLRGVEKRLELPIRRIILAHSGGDSCDSPESCKAQVKEIQRQNANLSDIPYNFLIGGDGSIFEGRGFNFQGEHTANVNGSSFNEIGICIAFIGTFDTAPPTDEQIAAFKNFTAHFVSQGLIVEDFKIFSQDQLAKPTTVPADALFEVMKEFPEFYSVKKVYRRDEWGASESLWESRTLNVSNPILRWIINHEYDIDNCVALEDCVAAMKERQQFYHGLGSGDFRLNFLIGGDDGLIFEGRGYELRGGTHTEIGFIQFLGNFTSLKPTKAMIDNLKDLLQDSVALGKVSEEYVLSTFLELQDPGNKGEALLEEISQFERYSRL